MTIPVESGSQQVGVVKERCSHSGWCDSQIHPRQPCHESILRLVMRQVHASPSLRVANLASVVRVVSVWTRERIFAGRCFVSLLDIQSPDLIARQSVATNSPSAWLVSSLHRLTY